MTVTENHLQQIRETAEPHNYDFLNSQRLHQVHQRLKTARHSGDRTYLKLQHAKEALRSGDPSLAIDTYKEIYQSTYHDHKSLIPLTQNDLDKLRVIALMRLAEQTNCCAASDPDACLLPFNGGGIHLQKEGMNQAITILNQILKAHPTDLESRWMHTVAEMALHGATTPRESALSLPSHLFESETDFPRFNNIARDLGIDTLAHAGGAIMEDFDNDGWLDLFTSSFSLGDSPSYFQNASGIRFRDLSATANIARQLGGLNLIQGDYDNDGLVDVLILRGGWFTPGFHPNSLLKNNGDGSFTDVTESAGLLSFHPTQTAAWFDYNNDGWLDLFVGNEDSESRLHPCNLYENNGDGTFSEQAKALGVDIAGFVKGVTIADYNNDRWPDIYVSMLGQPNILFRNDPTTQNSQKESEDRRFTDVTMEAGVSEPIHSFPTWFWDYNNDGWEDLFVAGYHLNDVGEIAAEYLGLPHQAATSRLYRNNGNGGFEDVTRDVGLDRILYAMGANYGDLNGDGWLDFYVGTGDPSLQTLIPNRLLVSDQGTRFHDATTNAGVGSLQKGHGIAIGDFDNDGDQDIYVNIGGWYESDAFFNALFENPGFGNNWITLELSGSHTNRSAIGARITLEIPTPNGLRRIHRTVSSGGSFGASPLRVEIGIGRSPSIHKLEVFWPTSNTRQVFRDLQINNFYQISESDGAETLLPIPFASD